MSPTLSPGTTLENEVVNTSGATFVHIKNRSREEATILTQGDSEGLVVRFKPAVVLPQVTSMSQIVYIERPFRDWRCKASEPFPIFKRNFKDYVIRLLPPTAGIPSTYDGRQWQVYCNLLSHYFKGVFD
jgi:hypothetical protein